MMDTFFWQVPHCHHHPHHEIGWDPDFLLAFCNGLERWGLDGAHLSLDPEYPDPLAVAMASRLWIGAMPVTTDSRCVAVNRSVALTNTLRLVASGIQMALQPISSISAASSLLRDHG